MRTLFVLLVLSASSAQAAPLAELAVFSAFSQADHGVSHFIQLRRTGVTAEFDIVIAMGGPKPLPSASQGLSWNEGNKVGIFLQERSHLERVYLLGTKSGFPDCYPRVERVTATDSVISCRGEKSEQYPNQKWTYDISAKSLISQFSYRPFGMHQIFLDPKSGGVVFVGTDRQRLIAVEYSPAAEPAFRVLGASAAQPWTRRVRISSGTVGMPPEPEMHILADEKPVPSGVPGFPRTTYRQFASARPHRAQNGYDRERTEFDGAMGPWQREASRVWFGKTFYDGEGSTDVGGFGYFDEKEKKQRLFAPRELADWSVSALAATPDAVWLGLVNHGEWGGSSGGLLRYDRRTGTVRLLSLPDIVGQLTHTNGKIIAATEFGFAVVNGDRVTRFFLDQTANNQWRVVPATR